MLDTRLRHPSGMTASRAPAGRAWWRDADTSMGLRSLHCEQGAHLSLSNGLPSGSGCLLQASEMLPLHLWHPKPRFLCKRDPAARCNTELAVHLKHCGLAVQCCRSAYTLHDRACAPQQLLHSMSNLVATQCYVAPLSAMLHISLPDAQCYEAS